MNFNIQYHELLVKEGTPKLSSEVKQRIKKAIEEKLMIAPEHFGKPLRRSLKDYRKLRSGDFRIIFRIEESFIKILMIQHHSVVYNKVNKRI